MAVCSGEMGVVDELGGDSSCCCCCCCEGRVSGLNGVGPALPVLPAEREGERERGRGERERERVRERKRKRGRMT